MKKQRAAIALVDSWLADTSGYDKRVWPRLSRRIEDPCVKPNPDPQFRESERGLRISKKLQGAVACNRCYAKLLRQRKVDMRMLMRVGVCRRCFNAPFLGRVRLVSTPHRLGDERVEPSSDQLAAMLDRSIAGLPNEIRSTFTAKVRSCIKTRDAAVDDATRVRDFWTSAAAGGNAEETAKGCLNIVLQELDRVFLPVDIGPAPVSPTTQPPVEPGGEAPPVGEPVPSNVLPVVAGVGAVGLIVAIASGLFD